MLVYFFLEHDAVGVCGITRRNISSMLLPPPDAVWG